MRGYVLLRSAVERRIGHFCYLSAAVVYDYGTGNHLAIFRGKLGKHWIKTVALRDALGYPFRVSDDTIFSDVLGAFFRFRTKYATPTAAASKMPIR